MGKSTINGPFSIAMFLFTGGYSIPWYSHSKTNPFYYGWLWLLRNGSLDNSFRRFIIFCEPVYHRFSVEKTGKPLLLKWSLKQNFELIIGNLNYHNWYSKTTLKKKERTNNKIWGSLLVFPQPSCRFLKEVQRPWPFEGWNTSEVLNVPPVISKRVIFTSEIGWVNHQNSDVTCFDMIWHNLPNKKWRIDRIDDWRRETGKVEINHSHIFKCICSVGICGNISPRISIRVWMKTGGCPKIAIVDVWKTR